MPRRGSMLPKLLALTVACAISVLIVELGWRIFIAGPAAFSFEKMNGLRYIGVAGVLQRAEFPEIAYELKPDLDTWHQLVPLRTNSQGLNDEEYALEPPPGTFRVVVLGDSYAMAEGLRREDLFHSRLEERFTRESAGLRYEFVNFAVSGYSLRQYVAVLRHKALAYRPDLVLVGFCGRNDHHIHRESIYREPYQPLEVYNAFFRLTFLRQLRSAWNYRIRPLLGLPTPHEEREAGDKGAYMEAMFQQLHSLAREAGAGLLVVLLDTQPSPVRQQLAGILAAQGIPLLDASIFFHDKDPDDYAILRNDEHPNAEAHQIFADEIHDFLIREGLVGRDGRI